MSATSNIPLNVPFKEKDEAKSHGARWNPDSKHWYVPIGVDATPFEKWLNGAPADTSKPQAAVPTKVQTTTQEKPNTLPANTDIDDVNAMLRDAFEVNDSQ